MDAISLNASMRSCLLNLQGISRLQETVQTRLSTGLKVNSAIENPSSYYTAVSLINRADDLNTLLDAMSQSIQTLKAASAAIDKAMTFLEQARAVADQAFETCHVPDKDYFIEKAGENGAVVETAQELLDAVNSGKEMIVVYGCIDIHNQGFTLKQEQKLVGTEYFTGSGARGSSRFSRLNFTADKTLNAIGMQGKSLISDLSITYSNPSDTGAYRTIVTNGSDVRLNNLDIEMQAQSSNWGKTVICAYSGTAALTGNISLKGCHSAIGAYGGTIKVSENCTVNIDMNGGGIGFLNYQGGKAVVAGKIKMENTRTGFENDGIGTDGKEHVLEILKSAEIQMDNTVTSVFYNRSVSTGIANRMIFAAGAKLSVGSHFFSLADFSIIAATNVTLEKILANPENYGPGNAFSVPDIREKNRQEAEIRSLEYNSILAQYDMLIADASYKGINLLQNLNLKVNFNEKGSSAVEIPGVKARSEDLGIRKADWKNRKDIEVSVSELEDAVEKMRLFASGFGNCLNIISCRRDFTENLINVLEEGADRLTLADMNQESANQLSLQTRQQLAVNALALAAQASRSVLQLF